MQIFQIFLNDKLVARSEIAPALRRRYDVSDKHIRPSLPSLIKQLRNMDPPYELELRIDNESYYKQSALLAHEVGEAKLMELTTTWQLLLDRYVERLERDVEEMESQIGVDDERYYSMFTDQGNLAVHQLYLLLLELAKMPKAGQQFMREAAKKGLELIGHEALDSDVQSQLSEKLEEAWNIKDQQEYRLYFAGFDEAKRRGFIPGQSAETQPEKSGAI